MSLTEIMSSLGRDEFAQIGLVLFVLIFAGVLVHVSRRRNAARFERARRLPLDDALPARRERAPGAGGHEEVNHG